MERTYNKKQHSKNSYDYEGAAKLRNYVFKRYRNQLKPTALHLYQGLQPLEEKGLGLCKPITAAYRDIAKESIISIASVRSALDSLNGALCEVMIGDTIKSNATATIIRRFTLDELMHGEPRFKLIDFEPPEAGKLSDLLKSRTFTYGDGLVSPYWNVLRTGRIQSNKPNIQGDSAEKREQNLCAGLKNGEVLISADFKSAEPTIIQRTINYCFDENPYDLLAKLMEITRSEAKQKVNTVAYVSGSSEFIKNWSANTHEFFIPYAIALDEYKEKLWKIGEPKNKQCRFVHTLGGTKIVADKGSPPHRGQILSWQIQGTVADILNAACLDMIAQEQIKGWKFCFPVHDSVYVIGMPEHVDEIKNIMEAKAKMLNIDLRVDTKIIHKI